MMNKYGEIIHTLKDGRTIDLGKIYNMSYLMCFRSKYKEDAEDFAMYAVEYALNSAAKLGKNAHLNNIKWIFSEWLYVVKKENNKAKDDTSEETKKLRKNMGKPLDIFDKKLVLEAKSQPDLVELFQEVILDVLSIKKLVSLLKEENPDLDDCSIYELSKYVLYKNQFRFGFSDMNFDVPEFNYNIENTEKYVLDNTIILSSKKSKKFKVAYDLYNKDNTMREVSQILNRSLTCVEEHIRKYKQFKALTLVKTLVGE